METAEMILSFTARAVALVLEFTAVFCICIGVVSTFILWLKSSQVDYSPLYNRLRLKFGGWLALALEFLLAADIIQTTASPTYEHLIELGAIAIIRTFLNYFLSKELSELPKHIREHLVNEESHEPGR